MQGLHDMLKFADKAWVFEGGTLSMDQMDGYWTDAAPVPKVRRTFFYCSFRSGCPTAVFVSVLSFCAGKVLVHRAVGDSDTIRW